MKTQAWGWLVAGVLAAGLNASYHDGGLQWAHRIADQVEQSVQPDIEHSAAAVLALARGRTEQFLSEARLVTGRDQAASCRVNTSLEQVQTELARAETGFARFDRMNDELTASQDVQMARMQANRDRMQARAIARINRETARIHLSTAAFNPVVVRVSPVTACARIRVMVPQLPAIHVPSVQVPEIRVPAVHIPAISIPAIRVPAQNIDLDSESGPI